MSDIIFILIFFNIFTSSDTNSMPIHNTDIAKIFEEIANILQLDNANPFRVRAYRNAARMLNSMSQEVSTLLENNEDLTHLPTIGKDLAAKIEEIIQTGQCLALQKLRESHTADLTELLKIPGLGPRKVHALYHDLDINSTEQLLRAAKDGRLKTIPGFGEKTTLTLIKNIESHLQKKSRIKLSVAAQYAEPYSEYLNEQKDSQAVVIAGSYRRNKDTVGDLDILVCSKNSRSIVQAFVEYGEVSNILSKGSKRSTVLLKNNLQVDLRVVAKKSMGAALHYFTGSKAHNIAIRRRAQQQGLKVNEYGVFRDDIQIAGSTEESVYKAVGLPWIPPELRENQGEIEAAEKGTLPNLVQVKDLKGDLHTHTKATDGYNNLKEMADAAKQYGLSYLAITEHSKHLTVAHGLTAERLLKQIDEIDELNDTLDGITILKGIEVDILEDGSLDLPDNVLSKLDLVIGAIHSNFKLSRDKQTKRVLNAMQHPYFSILAHPTGRLLEHRDAYDVDMNRIIREAKQRGCYLELNAQPERLDLSDTYCQMAKNEGVLISVNSDSHNINGFDNLKYGIGQARRGWLESKNILNTHPFKQVQELLRKTMV